MTSLTATSSEACDNMEDTDYSGATALIFNIVHGSFVDGWGIRTTIFLKGCPLRCVWCCNPEGQSLAPELKITYDKCTGCGRCVPACPKSALSIKDGVVTADRALCDGCGKCESTCWYGALGIFGKAYTAAEIFDIVRKDEPFYKSSGGGVTIGGGEATYSPEFCLGLIGLCHARDINVAIDSCGYVTSEAGLEVYRRADLILFDIKGVTDASHIANTGVSKTLIHKNLRFLDSIGKPVIIRVPVIPDYNADTEELHRDAEFIAKFGCVERVDILPFHEYGKAKYLQIGREYRLRSRTVPDEQQQQIKELFTSYGMNVQIGG